MATRQPASKKAGATRASTRTSARAAPRKPSTGEKSVRARAQEETESPLLPVEQLKRLREIKPDAVDWVIQQTQLEAEHRREETKRVNELIFIEHLLAQIFALIIGVAGILGGAWVAVNGQPWPGAAIAAAVVAALAFANLSGTKQRS